MGLFDKLNQLNLDDISKKLTDIGQEAFNQGSALAGTAKNKMKSADIEKQLNAVYAEIGRKYYETIKDSPSEEYKELANRVSDLNTQLQFYREEVRREKGITVCPSCGAEVTYGTAYCSNCGSIVSQPGVITFVKCPSCGRDLPMGTQFCTACGTNVSQVQPTAVQMPLGQVNLNGGMISTPAAPATMNPAVQPAPATMNPVAQPAPAAVNPAVQPAGLTLNKEPAPAAMNPTVQPAGLTLNKEPAPAAMNPTVQPAGLNLNKAPAAMNPTVQPAGLNLNKAPAAVNPTAQPAPAPMSGFPNGGPGYMHMDIDTSTTYGDTNKR